MITITAKSKRGDVVIVDDYVPEKLLVLLTEAIVEIEKWDREVSHITMPADLFEDLDLTFFRGIPILPRADLIDNIFVYETVEKDNPYN